MQRILHSLACIGLHGWMTGRMASALTTCVELITAGKNSLKGGIVCQVSNLITIVQASIPKSVLVQRLTAHSVR